MMRKLSLFFILVFVAPVFSACTTEQGRGVYEAGGNYDKGLKSTPLEKSREERPSYDQYERERRDTATERRD